MNSVPHSGLPGSRETKAPATTLLLVVHSFHEGYMQCLQSGRTVSEPAESEQVVSLVRFRTSSNCPRYDAYSARSDRRQRTGGGLRPHPCRYLRDSTQMGYLDKITSAPLSFVRHFVRLLVRPLLSCQQTSEAVNQDIVTIHHSPFTILEAPSSPSSCFRNNSSTSSVGRFNRHRWRHTLGTWSSIMSATPSIASDQQPRKKMRKGTRSCTECMYPRLLPAHLPLQPCSPEKDVLIV